MSRLSLIKLLAMVTLALSLALPAASPAKAQGDLGVPGGPFSTAFRIQNLGSANANCAYKLYSATGTQAFDSAASSTTAVLPILPNESAYIFTPSVTGIPSGQTLAGVVECDQPVAAVVNYSDTDSGDTYVGVSSPATTLYVPSIYDNYYNFYTSLRIMNASSSTNTGKIEYFQGTTKVGEDTLNLAANGSTTVNQNGKTFLNADVGYSAKITGSGNLAAIVQIYGGVGTGVADQLYAFSAFSGGATKVYAPVVMSGYYGYNTAITVQNAGSATANVTVTYSNSTTRSFTLASGASNTLLDFQILPAATSLYSAVIESTNAQPLIVTVNESNSAKYATTYEGLTSGGTNLVAPIVMKEYYGFGSSVTCQNIGTSTANVQVAYAGTSGTGAAVSIPATTKVTLAPNTSDGIFQFNDTSLPNGFIGSAIITANQNIICVVNQSIVNNAPTNQDQLYAYNAIVK